MTEEVEKMGNPLCPLSLSVERQNNGHHEKALGTRFLYSMVSSGCIVIQATIIMMQLIQ